MRRLGLLVIVLTAAGAAVLAGCDVLKETGLDEVACAFIPGDGTAVGGECGGGTCTACETCVEDPLGGAMPMCREVCLYDTDCDTGCCGFTPGALARVCLDAGECEVSCGEQPCTPGERCADDPQGNPVCAPQCSDDGACATGCCVVSSSGDSTCHDPSFCTG